MPCQVHSWMEYYLKTYLKGMDQNEAYDYFGMDPVIYTGPDYIYDEKDLAKWEVAYHQYPIDAAGNTNWERTITTPEGVLTEKGSFNKFTPWITKHIIQNERDFDLWNK